MIVYRVRENTRDIKGIISHFDFKNYWVYVSDFFYDYRDALRSSIRYDKCHPVGSWVEAIEM